MMKSPSPPSTPQLGLRRNLAQFSLLVLVNGFVGAMVGMERSILPAMAEKEFHQIARTAILAFIMVFGVTKAVTNYFSGRLSEIQGRKTLLVAGWIVAAPVPFLLMHAPSWSWILFANALLGISQGLTWSMTVIMKIDLTGPQQRGLAMGLNEFSGYLAVAGAALLTGYLASRYGLRPEPFYPGVVFVLAGISLSIFAVRETRHHVTQEVLLHHQEPADAPTQGKIFLTTTFLDPNLSSITQAGLVNNLNDGMMWGLFPLLLAGAKMNFSQIGWLTGLYPAVWGIGQIVTGPWSDRVGRKPLIVGGMWIQAAGIGLLAVIHQTWAFAAGAVLLGLGTTLVYPTLLAAIGDMAHPRWRASAVGVYRFWRDLGYAIGALLTGILADLFGIVPAILGVAALTFASGLVAAVRMRSPIDSPSFEKPNVKQVGSRHDSR